MSQYNTAGSDIVSLLHPDAMQMIRFIQRETLSWQGLRVLDTACGAGELAIALQSRGAFVTAVDMDNALLERARAIARQVGGMRQPHFVLGNLLNLPGDENAFQVILCLANACAFLPDEEAYLRFFRQCSRLLVPGGRLIMQLLNYDRILDFHDYVFPDVEDKERGFTLKRHMMPNAQHQWELHTQIRHISMDKFQIGNYVTVLHPLTRHRLAQMLTDHEFGGIDFYGDVDANIWKADSIGTVCVAVRK